MVQTMNEIDGGRGEAKERDKNWQNHELIHQYLLAVHLTTDMKKKGLKQALLLKFQFALTTNLTSYIQRSKREIESKRVTEENEIEPKEQT